MDKSKEVLEAEAYYERLREEQKEEGTYNPHLSGDREYSGKISSSSIIKLGSSNFYELTHSKSGAYLGLPTIEYDR